jgi:hydrogenase maturation protease
MKPSKWLVVALGNPLAGPDGFGAAVLERVCATPDVHDVADLLDAHTDLLGQIDRLARYERVLLIDAVVGLDRPGDVAVYQEERFALWCDTASGCHQLSPLTAIKLLRRLHPGALPNVVLVAWSVDQVSRAVSVSETAVAAGARLVVDLLFDRDTSTVASPSPAA